MTFSYEDISGTLVNYFGHCRRQAWLFNYGLRLEGTSDTVKMGRYIDQKRFSRKGEVEIAGERMKIDFVEKNTVPIELHEVKASLRKRDEHKLQIGFYLSRLKTKGIDAVGVIHYPEIREKTIVNYEQIEGELEKTYSDIVETMRGACPPRLTRKFCGGCAYYEFCYSTEED